jgi:hypothetical protein
MTIQSKHIDGKCTTHGEMTNYSRTLVCKSQGKREIRRPIHKWMRGGYLHGSDEMRLTMNWPRISRDEGPL